MSNGHSPRHALVLAATLGVVAAGCGHTASQSAQLHDGFAPFSSTRAQAVGLVANTKRFLGAADLNALAVAYTSLQEKANAYDGFMVEAVTTSSFDQARNNRYADDLSKAIAAFDKALAGLTAAHQSAAIPVAWVQPFAQTLAARWDQYRGAIATMSPETKADLIAQLKRETVWPNYEDIATEPVVGSR